MLHKWHYTFLLVYFLLPSYLLFSILVFNIFITLKLFIYNFLVFTNRKLTQINQNPLSFNAYKTYGGFGFTPVYLLL